MRRRTATDTGRTSGKRLRRVWCRNLGFGSGHKCDSEGEAVNTHMGVANVNETLMTSTLSQWFAVQTRSRHEKKVADELIGRCVEVFVPLIKRTRKWSDRTREVEFPLFSGYAFVNIVPEPK